MSNIKNINNAAIGPISIPIVKGITDALALGTAAYGISQTEQDYQTEFLRNHGVTDPREEVIRGIISKPDILKNTTYIPRRHTSYISQPTITPETEWYTANPGTIYGGTIPTVIVNAPRVESRIGDAFGILTGKKTVARDSTQTNQRDSTQTRKDSTRNNRPNPSSNEDSNTGKYFDWNKDMSWETPSESILKWIFKPRINSTYWMRTAINYAPFGIGGYVIGKKLGWIGNKENNDSKENSNQTQGYDPHSSWD